MASQEPGKSAGMYVLGAAQISLQLLGSLSSLIPIPYVGIAISVASKVIEVAQSVKDNAEGAQALSDRVYAITIVVLTPLRGKRQDQIPDDTRQNIERLTRDLLAIEKDIQRVKKRIDASRVMAALRDALGCSDISGLLASCTARLDWAMRDFAIQSHIQESIRMAQMSDKLDQVHDRVGEILVEMRELNIAPTVSLPSSVIPPKPELFYGRDFEVNDIARRMISTLLSRFAITGPGGIGKTALASAVLEHTDVVQHFGSRIHWARCDEATSPPLLTEVIARSFRLDQPSKDRLQDIKSFLHSSTQPRLLVLDNFETPWDIEGRQSDITDILCNIWTFSHLSILVTMRGTLPGVGRIKWTKPELPSLSVLPVKAARDLYIEIDPTAGNDTALEPLLSELDHMPLAVTLMAKVGSEGETPTELLKKWGLRGTDIIHEDGGDRRTSINLSIQVSLQSQLLKNNPDAIRLLSVLAVLPGGIRNDIIHSVVPDISDPTKARSILLRTSLVYSRAETNSFHVLSPIRTYIARYHPPTPGSWKNLYGFCYNYIAQSDPKDIRAFNDALSIENMNLEAVLSHALQHDPSEAVIDVSLRFTSYQLGKLAQSGPDLAIIAVEAAKRVGTAYQVAVCLWRLGNVYLCQRRLKDARTALEDARARSIQLGEGRYAAECISSLGFVAYVEGRYDNARSSFETGHHEFVILGDTSKPVDLPMESGQVALMEDRRNDVQQAYEDTCVKNRYIGQGIAFCLLGLGNVARKQGLYEESRKAYKQARSKAVKFGAQMESTYSLLWLGVVDFLQEQYVSAREALLEVQEEFIQCRDSNGVAECLKWLGNVDGREGRFEEARTNLERAHLEFVRMGQSPDIAECLQGLGYVETAEGRYKDARQHLEEALAMSRRLGIPKGVADCLTVFGDLSIKEGLILEARSELDEAHAAYEKMRVHDWWQSRCVGLLASLPMPSCNSVL
ncbi:hypothetical protein FRB93_003906 [Tulasnella sp. JGI-2019a]|nr:hypothetical protein FRB93_003906 [Tulasnella sp. JGI-2019a]